MKQWSGALAVAVALAACAGPGPLSSYESPSYAVLAAPSSPPPIGTCAEGLPPAEAPVYAFFTCADDDATPPWETHPVPRPAQAADLVSRLEAALVGLLAGPTKAEQAAGYTSLFSERTAGALNGVSLGLDGMAAVDLGDIRPFMGTASTSAGMQYFLSQLNATVFQFEEVAAVEYRINGSCQVFWEWLQGMCQIVSRP